LWGLERRFVVADVESIVIAIGPEPGDGAAMLLEVCNFVLVGAQRSADSVGLD